MDIGSGLAAFGLCMLWSVAIYANAWVRVTRLKMGKPEQREKKDGT